MLCSDLRDSLFSTDTRHILEIGKYTTSYSICADTAANRCTPSYSRPVGAGTGIVAITLAVLRATLDCGDHPGSIVTTDLCACTPPVPPSSNLTRPSSHYQPQRYLSYRTTSPPITTSWTNAYPRRLSWTGKTNSSRRRFNFNWRLDWTSSCMWHSRFSSIAGSPDVTRTLDTVWQTSPTIQHLFLHSWGRWHDSSRIANAHATDSPRESSWATRSDTPTNDHSGIAPTRSASISNRLDRSTGQVGARSKFGWDKYGEVR